MTLETWVRKWLVTYKRIMVKPSTYDSYLTYVTHVKCDVELSELSNFDIQKLISDMVVEGLKLSTIKHMLTLVRQALKKARALGMISNLSMLEDLELPRRLKNKINPLNSSEIEKIKHCSNMSFYGDFFLTLLYTGCRVGELIALRWCDVNMFNREIHIRNTDYHGELQDVKTDSGVRTIPLYDDLYGIFRKLYRARTSERVFLNTLGLPIKYRSVLDAWKCFIRKIGISPCGFHKLRHTFAHNALRAGVPVKVVSAWLGHADVYITIQIYDSVVPDDLWDAAEILQKKTTLPRNVEKIIF